MELDPAKLEASERYRLLIGGIVPRPIAVVGSCDAQGGNRNLAPFSFFSGLGSAPMSLLFCPANDDAGLEKDTLRNCKPRAEGGCGEFTVSVAAEPIIRKVVAAGADLPYGEDEFQRVGLTAVASTKVAPPRVAESPLTFECATRQVIRLNAGVPGGGNIVVGEVVWVHAADGLLDARGQIDAAALAAVGRMGALSYCRTSDRFDLPWGLAAL